MQQQDMTRVTTLSPEKMQQSLERFLEHSRINPETYIAIRDGLNKLGCINQSLTVLKRAYELNPRDETILCNIILDEVAAGNASNAYRYLESLKGMRVPGIALRSKIEAAIDGSSFSEKEKQTCI